MKLGWKTNNPQPGTIPNRLSGDYTISYTQGGQTIYSDASGGGFNVDLDDDTGDLEDNGTCSGWSNLNVSGCHGSASNVSWSDTASLVCNACHGENGRNLDKWGHSFDDASA